MLFGVTMMDEILSFLRTNAWMFPALVLGIGWARYYLKTHDIEKRYEDCKAERDKCRQVCAALEEELGRLKSVSVFRHWLYLPSDPEPRCPICPTCYAGGRIIRMSQHTSDVRGQVLNWFSCPEAHKSYRFFIAPEDANQLFELLGGSGCYNPEPAQSSNQPQQRPARYGMQMH